MSDSPNTTSPPEVNDLVVDFTGRVVIPASIVEEGGIDAVLPLLTAAPQAVAAALAASAPVEAQLSSVQVVVTGGIGGMTVVAGESTP